jgi:hypothetical protein
MLAISIKSIFSDHWKSEKLALTRRYESSPCESIVESVEKMLSCREFSSGDAEYICFGTHEPRPLRLGQNLRHGHSLGYPRASEPEWKVYYL